MADEAGKALVIVMNKWDLVDEERQLVLDKEIDRQLERYPWAQRVNLSAKTGWHRDRLAPALRTALTNWEKRIPTAKLNAFLGELVAANPPPVRSGKQPKIKFATQAGTCPPKFVVFATGFLETAYRHSKCINRTPCARSASISLSFSGRRGTNSEFCCDRTWGNYRLLRWQSCQSAQSNLRFWCKD